MKEERRYNRHEDYDDEENFYNQENADERERP